MSLLASKTRLDLFSGLHSYSQADADLLNAFASLFHSAAKWRSWLQEGLGTLLGVPGTRVVSLKQVNQIDAADSRERTFEKEVIAIGRDPGNDVAIAIPGVGRHHARITRHASQYFLEDLGSANGTFINETKLNPLVPVPIVEGAEFLIFPYQFTFSSRQNWSGHERVRLACGAAQAADWNAGKPLETAGMRFFSVKVSPDVGRAALGISEEFLKALVGRIGRGAVGQQVETDLGLLEFVTLSVLECANRDLKFPYRFSLETFVPPADGERGISLECTVGLTGATGLIEMFLPAALLRQARRSQGESLPTATPVSWPILATAGHADLSLSELADLEVGDIVVCHSSCGLLLPATGAEKEHGWRAVRRGDQPLRLEIEEFFRRSDLMKQSESAAPDTGGHGKPDLTALPVRVHVVLSQLDMTLAELNRLTPGSIVELDREKEEAVQVAVNGKIAGAGELVEIEGRLGVRILSWAAQ